MKFVSAAHLTGGGTITGDLTISGDLTVSGGGSYAYSEVLTGDIKITNAFASDSVAADDATSLHVDFDRATQDSGTAAHNDIGIDLDVSSSSKGTSTAIGMDIDVVGAGTGTQTATGLTVDVSGGNTNYAALFNGGNVGIGVVDPDHELEVAGKVHISDEGSAPAAPSAGDGGVLYTKADGKPYWISDDVAEVALTNTVAVSADLDYGGYYSLNEQGRTNHVSNTMPAPYYRFDGVDDRIDIDLLAAELTDTSNTKGSIIWRGKLNDLTTDHDMLWGFGDTSADEYIILKVDATNYKFTVACRISSAMQWEFTTDDTYSEGIEYDIILVQNGTSPVLYINGVLQDITFSTTTDQTAWFHSTTGIDNGNIGCLDYTNGGNVFFGEMEVNAFNAFNLALTATEVKELYSGASVPFKYKGANQTELVTNGAFTSNTTGWTGTRASLASVSGGQSGNCLEITRTGGDDQAVVSDATSTVIGKHYRVTGYVKSGTSGDEAYSAEFAGIGATGTTSDEWVSFSFVQVATATNHTIRLNKGTSTAGTMLFDTVSVTQIGAVAEYDGSTAGAHQWGDKSGNELHGTVGAGTGDATAPTLENTPYDSGTEYEEGTFTPTWATGFSSVTYDIQTGRYTKIGDHVTAWIVISVSSTSASGNLTFELPLNAKSGVNNFVGQIYVQTNSGTLASTTPILRCGTASGADATVYVMTQGTGGGASMAGSELGDSTVNMVMTYQSD